MDGYRGRDYYTKEEFDEACSFNWWFGVGTGMVGASGFILIILAWVFNWI
jgi:hypothetical protein